MHEGPNYIAIYMVNHEKRFFTAGNKCYHETVARVLHLLLSELAKLCFIYRKIQKGLHSHTGNKYFCKFYEVWTWIYI